MDLQKIKNNLQNVLNPNNSLIKQSEEYLQNCAKQNLGNFILLLAQIICNENEMVEMRQISATLIKNVLILNEYKQVWLNLDLQFKKVIKDTLLSTLASNNHNVRKATALAIAGIAKIEIPNKQWNDIFNNLTSATTNSQVYIQNTAVIAITYILQEVEIKDITLENLNLVLNGFFTILNNSKDEGLLNDTLMGVDVIIPFLSKIFEDKNNRNSFLTILYNFLTNSNYKIRKEALKIIISYVKYYYDYLLEFMSNLLDISKTLLKNDTNENKIICYEIWTQICEIEILRDTDEYSTKKSNNFIQKSYPYFIDIVLEHLITNEYFDDEWTIQKAAGNLISVMCQCTEFEFTKNMIDYTGKNFNLNDEHKIHAALFCFGCIIKTKHTKYLESIIINSLPIFEANLNNNNIPYHIKNISAWVIRKVTYYYGKYLNTYQNGFYCKDLFAFLIGIISNMDKSIQCQICHSLHNLCKNNYQIDGNTNIFSSILEGSANILIKLGCNQNNYDTENNVCLASFFALGSLLEKAAEDTSIILQSIFEQLNTAFIYTLDPNNISDKELRNLFQNYITSTLTSILTNQNKVIDINKLSPLFSNILKSFILRNELYEEGLILIGSISLILKGNFKSLIDQFYPYLKNGLESINSCGICSCSLLTLSDIIRSMEIDFEKYVPDIINKIFLILEDSKADRKLKPLALNVVGDLFLIKFPTAFSNLDDIMKILGLAMSASSMDTNINDNELTEYLISLRETIIESLTLIFSSCKSPEYNMYMKFIPYVPPIMNYLLTVCNKDKRPSLDILLGAFGLIGDFCCTYQKEMKTLINREFIMYLMTEIKQRKNKSNDEKALEQTIEYTFNQINNATN